MSWTEEQLAAHYARLKTPEGCSGEDCPPGRAPKERAPDRLEAPIQAECLKLLEEDGWRILVTNPVSDRSKGKGFGELGMADAMAIRYLSSIQLGSGAEVFVHRGTCEILWLEFKRGKGGILSSKQREWHIRERARGALTVILGEDCPASVEGFRSWYRASGLARRRVL